MVLASISVAMMPAAIKKLESTPMYDPHLLEELDWTLNTVTFSPAISPEDPGDGLVLRPLCSTDINRGIYLFWTMFHNWIKWERLGQIACLLT